MIPSLCDCKEDGYCQRYKRDMSGRFREICRGQNCDLGTSAAFRMQWQMEADEEECDDPAKDNPVKLLLQTDQAPGDAVAMTAAIYSLHRTHLGKYLTAVESRWPDVFLNNPHVTPRDAIPDALPLRMHYPAIHDSNKRGIHFMQGWCEFLGFALGIQIPLQTNRPHLYFPPRDEVPATEDYWVICSGGKTDFTNKLWGHLRYQELVRLLKGDIRFIQVGRCRAEHPKLYGTKRDLVGKTDLRELFDVIRRARGVVCGVSLTMHIAAAFGIPAIVIAGGREPVAWNAYPKQQYLHTVGMLPCTDPQGRAGGACWRSRLHPLGDGTVMDEHTCVFPSRDERGSTAPACMALIHPETVAALVRRYNGGRELPNDGEKRYERFSGSTTTLPPRLSLL